MATITISPEAFAVLKKFAEDQSLTPEQAAEMLISRHAAEGGVRIVKENGLSVLDIPGLPRYTVEQWKDLVEDSW